MAVTIVADTCHYLPAEVVAEQGVKLVSLYVNSGNVARRESEITDLSAYYAELGSALALPTTSQPSIGDFLHVYTPILDAGHDIVSIHLAGGMSGTVEAAAQARASLGARAERVHVVDSASACGGEGLVVLAAAAAARRGLDAAAVAEHARETRKRLKLWFAVDTLEYLRRGGRIAGAQAWLGTALRIKPILTVESEITPVERVRTSKRAFERMLELLRTCAEDGCDAYMIQHIQAPAEGAELARRAEAEIFGHPPVLISEIGPVIGTHVGPGLLGAGGVPASML